MEKRSIPASELVLSKEGKIYHLALSPGEVADTVFLVGDPGRVEMMSSLFDRVEHRVENREFVTHTGTYGGRRFSVISTGIGTDNIDIVLNELDALFNIDFDTRRPVSNPTSLRLVRIGTSGALHEKHPPGSTLVSTIAGGLDNLIYYYGGAEEFIDREITGKFEEHMQWGYPGSRTYFVRCSPALRNMFSKAGMVPGITLSSPGFYAPQGRSLRIPLSDPDFLGKVSTFMYEGWSISNFEMETSALYGLSCLLGHEAITICMVLANRKTGKFITDYQPLMQELLLRVLNIISAADEAGPF